MKKLFGVHIWKSGPLMIEEWQEVTKGCKVRVKRPEAPEEYHSRKKGMISILFFGKLFTFRFRRVKFERPTKLAQT